MTKIAFVSDFDGTITTKDYYKIIIDEFLGETGKNFYSDWKAKEKIGVRFLNEVFAMVSLSASEWITLAERIPIDASFMRFYEILKSRKIDFYVVSAGCRFYIEKLLYKLSIEPQKLIALPGEVENSKLVIRPELSDPYYSEMFGIDKGLFINDIKSMYDIVYFAGDSEPDYTASINADIAFCKGELMSIMQREKRDFISMSTFADIIEYFNK